MDIHELLKMASPVIPVIVLEDPTKAVSLANALVAGGVKVLEITLRTPSALRTVQYIRQHVPEAIVGVGTVIMPGQLAAAQQAGAQFAVSPGFTSEISQVARELALPLLPGAMTPSEIMKALAAGHTALKFFPAEPAGGVAMLKAFASPFANIKFCPTGGINLQSAQNYLALPNVVCVGSSWLVPKEAIANDEWAAVTALAQKMRQTLVC
jgi:2-dehydro-3-deoxyphosphogluconate aldolase/(4S)-4-hydroxy-2-oxoglutarate aldolase